MNCLKCGKKTKIQKYEMKVVKTGTIYTDYRQATYCDECINKAYKYAREVITKGDK